MQYMRSMDSNDYVSYGLLAANTLDALNHLENGTPLTEEELDILTSAADFMLAIADGAELVNEAKFNARHSAAASMKAFGVVKKGPIITLQDYAAREGGIANSFREFGELLQRYSVTGSRLNAHDKGKVEVVTALFEAISDSLLQEVTIDSQLSKIKMAAI